MQGTGRNGETEDGKRKMQKGGGRTEEGKPENTPVAESKPSELTFSVTAPLFAC